jgi:mono/diheme cytochrome c family protein
VRNTITEAATRLAILAAGVFQMAAVSFADVDAGLIEQGRYLVYAGGCISCHTVDEKDAVPLAGGHPLETPFGTFYAPNITPDDETGIGRWTDENFLDAFWKGVSPMGKHYFPAFPYTSYTGMTESDVLAIKAYLFSMEPVHNPNRKNELPWYLSTRLAAGAWKKMNFRPARFVEDPAQSAQWNRGAYLARHLGHCGECHTPRKKSGRILQGLEFAGQPEGPDREAVPDITPDREHGIGRWSEQDITMFMEFGMLPDGDFTGGDMSPVIDDNTSHLTNEDRAAIAVYLKSVTRSSELEIKK